MGRRPYVLALVLLAVVAGVVLVAVLRGPEAGVAGKATVEETPTNEFVGATDPGVNVAIRPLDADRVGDARIEILDATLTDSDLVAVRVGAQFRREKRAFVEEGSWMAGVIPHQAVQDKWEHAWLYGIEPSEGTVGLMAEDTYIAEVNGLNDSVVWRQLHDDIFTTYVGRPGRTAGIGFEQPITTPCSITRTFPEKNLLMIGEYEQEGPSIFRRVANQAVRRINAGWEYPRATSSLIVSEQLRLWDVEAQGWANESAYVPGANVHSISPLFGEDRDLFLAFVWDRKRDERLLVLYSLHSNQPLVSRPVQGWYGAVFFKSDADIEVIAVVPVKHGVACARIRCDAKHQVLKLEYLDVELSRECWPAQWANGLLYWKESDEVVILNAESNARKRVTIKAGLSKQSDFRISDNRRRVVTWNKSRLDVWDVDFPEVTWQCGYELVAGDAGPKFIECEM